MGTKMAVSFANIFMAKIEATLKQQSETKPKEWRRYIEDIFSSWDSDKIYVDQFIEQANKFHPTIKTTLGVRACLSLTYSLTNMCFESPNL